MPKYLMHIWGIALLHELLRHIVAKDLFADKLSRLAPTADGPCFLQQCPEWIRRNSNNSARRKRHTKMPAV